jgi:DNA-binding GntR family transcriptional regulator
MVEPQFFGGAIERRTLHDEVVDRMRDMIIEGQFKTHARINETELCRSLGVSRTPVREAIKTLASEGLIELVRNKGAIVKRLGGDEIVDLLEAVAVIERYAAEVGVERASDLEIDQIVKMHQRMRAYYKTRERLPYYKLNQAIHAAIVTLTHNNTLDLPDFSGERFATFFPSQLRSVAAFYSPATNVAGADYRSHQCIGQWRYQPACG